METELGPLGYYYSLKKIQKKFWCCSLSNLKPVTSGRQDPFIEDYILPSKKLSFASLTSFKGQGKNILKKTNVSSFLKINRMTFPEIGSNLFFVKYVLL